MCSPVDNKYSCTDRDIAETLNSVFTSVSKVNDENAILPNILSRNLVVFCTQSMLRLIKLKH